jgi:hypothetical protein
MRLHEGHTQAINLGLHVYLIHTMQADEACGHGHSGIESSWRQTFLRSDISDERGNDEKQNLEEVAQTNETDLVVLEP